VVVVEDEAGVRELLEEVLAGAGYRVTGSGNGAKALEALARGLDADLVITDLRMPGLGGEQLLAELRTRRPEVNVVVITAFGSIESAIGMVKAGAYDYLTKPFESIDDLTLTVTKAAERRMLRTRTKNLEEQLSVREKFEELVGQSSQMRSVFKLVETVSHSTATVLIQGEAGTGKELIARAIHYRSPRKDKPFVAINCSALTETLLESELFGHVKGAFTGALGNKQGLFEAANGGTIFLDEVGDLPPATQVRLLRVLQEGEVKPVGSNENIEVNVRVLAATHVDLGKAKSAGKFREDLFYRLNVIPLQLPPLRDRPDDVPLLATHFLLMHAKKSEKKVTGIGPQAMEALTLYRWPGNVRELENVMERAVVLTPNEVLELEDLPAEMRATSKSAADVEIYSLAHLPYAEAKRLAMRAFERRYLLAIIERNDSNISSAAKAAGIDRSNFRRLLKQYEVADGGALEPVEIANGADREEEPDAKA
jgi:DNA-binding NtrC family response regulator